MAGRPGKSEADIEQDKWMAEAVNNTKSQSFLMQRSLFDQNMIREGLKNAATMTGELRTSRLMPRNYYELYMTVTQELQQLETFFEEEDAKEQKGEGGHSVVELYETVQHCGNMIPRLYLLITVASVYIKSKKAPSKDILFDLVELCRGVQHPMRGLFLRNFLLQMSKGKLPDNGNEYDGIGGTVRDSVEFLLQNFAEMNKLWVRMQHQGAVKDRAKREKERQSMKQLVGFNLVRLSELQGVDLALYQELVLPRLLEQIINCKDLIAQEYLMDCIINVFPDEFHLRTLDTLLGSCSQLQEKVKVKDILITLLNRLSNFAHISPHLLPTDLDMFSIFHKYTTTVLNGNSKILLEDLLSLQVALANFASKVYPDRLNYIDDILAVCVETIKKTEKPKVEGAAATRSLVDLLALPVESLGIRVLQLTNYIPAMEFLEHSDRCTVAHAITSSVVNAKSVLDTIEKVDMLLNYVAPLVKDEGDYKAEEAKMSDDEKADFDSQQHMVARMFHLVQHDDTDVMFKLLTAARKHFGQGGTLRIEYTLPPLVYAALQLTEKTAKRETAGEEVSVKSKKMFHFCHETITALSQHYGEFAMRLFLQAAHLADSLSFEAIAYEFVTQAFLCYEEEINESKAQIMALQFMVGALQRFTNFGQENYDTLVSKATQHSAKLLRKDDQCRAVCECSHLFWSGDDTKPGQRDEKKVLACLQRSLKIANGCMGSQVTLFADILNKYLFFFDKKCPSITVKYLKGLTALIDEHIPSLDASDASKATKQYYENTQEHIKIKAALEDETGERYRTIVEGSGDEEAAPAEEQPAAEEPAAEEPAAEEPAEEEPAADE